MPREMSPVERTLGVLANKAQCATFDLVQLSSATLIAERRNHEDHRPGSLQPDVAYLGCMAAVGGLMNSAMIFAAKPDLTEEEIKETGNDEALKLVTTDTMLFTALVAAYMQRGEITQGRQDFVFGPVVFKKALAAWKAITGKEPHGILDKNLIYAIEQETQTLEDFVAKDDERLEIEVENDPFEAFLKKHALPKPSKTRLH